ncbi:MAG: hypothetical protein IT322_05645 [Anaerolineae bacterium]|nr:hypothetical protein [Anaerolineae bacterium]
MQTITGAKGPNSRRDFDPDQAGGPIRNLDYRKVKITHEGVDVVERHLSRFESYKPNQGMIARLRRIASGQMSPEPVDLRFYTHELREYVRYRRLGFPVGEPSGDGGWEMWNNTHTATLEDYKLNELIDFLYHPNVRQE